MASRFPWSWKEILAIVVLSALTIFVFAYDGTPRWVRAVVGLIVTIGPFAPLLALLPWYFVARHRGLAPRSKVPCVVSISGGEIRVERGGRRARVALGDVMRARMARNDNWTESKLLEDALGLFAESSRELARVPESAEGFEALSAELRAREIPVDDVAVSAPAFLD